MGGGEEGRGGCSCDEKERGKGRERKGERAGKWVKGGKGWRERKGIGVR